MEKSSFTTDAAALPQLQIISLPSGTDLTKSKGYVYDSSAGDGIDIYIIDSGLTPSNKVGVFVPKASVTDTYFRNFRLGKYRGFLRALLRPPK